MKLTKDNMEKLIKTVPTIGGVKPAVFLRSDGIVLSGEECDGLCDYYAFGGDGPFIHPELEAWAKKAGAYWEWESPGGAMLYNI